MIPFSQLRTRHERAMSSDLAGISGARAGAGAGPSCRKDPGPGRQMQISEVFSVRSPLLPAWGLPPDGVIVFPPGDADAVRGQSCVSIA